MKINTKKLFFLAGPCVIESEKLCLTVATTLAKLADRHGVSIVFKASYDKANRTSGKSFRGLGRDQGLAVLAKVRARSGLPVVTDIHTPDDAAAVAEVVDGILEQTDRSSGRSRSYRQDRQCQEGPIHGARRHALFIREGRQEDVAYRTRNLLRI